VEVNLNDLYFLKYTFFSKFQSVGKQCYCDLKKIIFEKSQLFDFRKFLNFFENSYLKNWNNWANGQTIPAFKHQKFDISEPSFFKLHLQD